MGVAPVISASARLARLGKQGICPFIGAIKIKPLT
jgi:hypothetical protein